jgi:hypothetical protein
LHIGQPLVAEARIALVVIPLCGRGQPGDRVCQCGAWNLITVLTGGKKRTGGITVVVARVTAVLARPRRDFTFEKFNGARLGLVGAGWL